MVAVTAFYAGLLTLLILGLSGRVIAARRAMGVSLSDGDDVGLRRRIRAHGNATEYVPIALLLLALLELQQTPVAILHVFGATLFVGRVLHAAALSNTKPWPLGRIAGMGLTLIVLFAMAITAILVSVF